MKQDNILTPELEMNYTWLDQFDFSRYLIPGMNFQKVIANIEEEYNEIIYNTLGVSLFEFMDFEDIMLYFKNRYHTNFQPYTIWRISNVKES